MNARILPVPEPPSCCAYGHEHFTTGADYIEGGVMVGYSACTACEDLRAHEQAYQEWTESGQAARWAEMDEAEAAFVATVCKDFTLLGTDERYGKGFGVYGGVR